MVRRFEAALTQSRVTLEVGAHVLRSSPTEPRGELAREFGGQGRARLVGLGIGRVLSGRPPSVRRRAAGHHGVSVRTPSRHVTKRRSCPPHAGRSPVRGGRGYLRERLLCRSPFGHRSSLRVVPLRQGWGTARGRAARGPLRGARRNPRKCRPTPSCHVCSGDRRQERTCRDSGDWTYPWVPSPMGPHGSLRPRREPFVPRGTDSTSIPPALGRYSVTPPARGRPVEGCGRCGGFPGKSYGCM